MTSVWGRRSALASLGAACLSAGPVLAEGAQPEKKHFSIAAQPADTAIDAIGRQANIQILAARRALHDRLTNAVQGDFPVREALAQLLAGTGLDVRQIGPQSYAVVVVAQHRREEPAPHAAPPAPRAPHERRHARPPPLPVLRREIDPIVVTGSLVISNGNRSPTPVTTMTLHDMLDIRPGGVVEALETLPALQGSINLTSNVNTGGFNMLNLRGIGSTRGLFLVDGGRIGSTQQNGAVDVDVIPQILLKRVDVVTGGASAAYGSDAVSGVVNFVTDKDFQGFKANIRGGVSRYGDDRKLGAGLAWGRGFADGRGHFEAGYEYSDNGGFTRASRPFFSPWASVVGSGTAASPYVLVRGATLNSASFGGLINSGPLAGLQFAKNGMLSAFNPGTPTSTSAVNIGGDGAYFTGSTAGAALVAHRAMARLDYTLAEGLDAHVSGLFARFKQSYTQQNPLLAGLSVGYNNAFLAGVQPQYQAIIASQPAGSSFQFSKLDQSLPNYQFNTLESYNHIDAGLKGRLGRMEWTLDAYRTQSAQMTRNNDGINLSHLYAAIDAVSVGGKAVCHAALGNPTYAGCVPLNLFGPSSDQAAAMAYVEQATANTQRFVTNDANAALRGTVLDLPAGPLKLAVMAEWRRSTYAVDSNAGPADTLDCNGIEFNCVNSPTALRYLGGQTAALAPVSQTVTEQAVEADIPLLAGRRLLQSLSINGAVRHTFYDTSGAAWTWKGGVVWAVSDALTLRMTRSHDIRAPNLYDLFQPQTVTTTNYTDLHTNTSGIVAQVSQGNPALKPEKAETLTLGGVFKPPFLPGFSLAVDYYRIDIDSALVNVAGFQPSTQSACESSGGSSPFCAFYIRPYGFSNTSAGNFPTALLSQTLNVASVNTWGVDVEANYATHLAHRDLAMRALVTWQPTLRYDNGAGSVVDVGGAADGVGALPPLPSVKVLASLGWQATGRLNVMAVERWRSSLRQNGNADLVFAQNRIPSIGYTDLSFKYTLDSHMEAYASIQNLFDTWPPVYASAGGSVQMNYLGGYAQGDDIEGRYITVGLRMRF